MAMTWEEYTQKYGQPYDLSPYVHMAAVDRPENYDDMRRANMDWQAQYYQMNQDQAPSAHETAMNPFIAGGNYYNQAVDTFGQATEVPGLEIYQKKAPTDWAAEAAAGRPVIGGYAPPNLMTAVQQHPAMVANQPGFNLGQIAPAVSASPQVPSPNLSQAFSPTGSTQQPMGTISNFWDDNQQASGGMGTDWQSMFDEWKKKQYGGA